MVSLRLLSQNLKTPDFAEPGPVNLAFFLSTAPVGRGEQHVRYPAARLRLLADGQLPEMNLCDLAAGQFNPQVFSDVSFV
jgi:hypothetical protein